MRDLIDFDPSKAQSGQLDTTLDGPGKIVLSNDSNITLTMDFGANGKAILPAWQAKLFTLCTPCKVATWTQRNIIPAVGSPVSLVQGEAFQQSEDVPGVYPLSLNRHFVGNSSVPTTQMSTINNDGQPAGQEILEATVQGSPGSNVAIYNDGTAAFKEYVSGVLTRMLQLVPGAANPVQLAATILDALTVSGTSTFSGAATFNQQVSVNAAWSQNGNMTVAGLLNLIGNLALTGSQTVSNALTVGGQVNVGGPLSLSNGDNVTGISHFSGTGSGTFAHNMGATPTFCFGNYSGNFGGPPTHPIYMYNWDGTNTVVKADNGFYWWGVALRF